MRPTLNAVPSVLLIIVLALAPLSCGGDRTEVKLDRARVALQRGELETARDLAADVVAERDDDREARAVLAEAQIGLSLFREARSNVDRLLKSDGEDAHHRRLAVYWGLANGQNLLDQVGFADSESLRKEFERTLGFGERHLRWRLDNQDDEAATHFDHSRLLSLRRRGYEARLQAQRLAADGEEDQQAEPGDHDPKDVAELEALIEQKWASYVEALHRTIQRDPDHATAAVGYMRSLAHLERFDELMGFIEAEAARDTVPVDTAVTALDLLRTIPPDAVEGDSAQGRIELMDALVKASSEQGRESHAWLLERGRLARIHQQWDEVEKWARRALDQRSEHGATLLLLAEALYQQGDYRESRRQLNRVRERDRHSGWLLLSGRLYRQDGEPQVAIQELGRAVRANPGNIEIRRERRQVLREMGQLDLVRDDSEQFYRNNPAMPAAIEEVLEMRLLDDDRAAVAALLDEVAELEPLSDEHRRILVRGNVQIRRLPIALEHARALVGRHPDDMGPRLTKAGILSDMGRAAEARQIAQQLLEQFPDADRPSQLLARLDRREGRVDAAVERLVQVVEREPGNVDARIGLAESLIQLALFNDAREHLTAALQQDPAHTRAHELMARLYHLEGRDDQAAQHLAQIDQGRLDPVRDALVLAGQRRRAGDREGALAALREGIAAGEPHQEVPLRLMLSRMLAERGDLRDAEDQLLQAARLAPAPYVLGQLVRFYRDEATGGPPRGLEVLEQLAGEMPGRDAIDLARAQLHTAQRQISQAIPLARRALMAQMDRGDRGVLRTAVFNAQLLAASGRWEEADNIFQVMEDRGVLASEARMARILLNQPRVGDERTLAELVRFGRGLLADQTVLRQQVVRALAGLDALSAADELVSRWVEQQPEDVAMLHLKAAVALQGRRPGEAASWLERAVELEPRNLRYRSELAQVHIARRDFPAAEQVFRDMRQIDTGAAIHGLSQLGAMFIELGLDQQAVATFNELERTGRPNDPRVLLSMGLAHARLDQPEQAMQRLGQVPSYAPQYPRAQIVLARLESQQGRRDSARQRLERLTERRDTAAHAATELARLNLEDPDGHARLVEWADERLEIEGLPQEVRNAWQSLRISVADRGEDWDRLGQTLAQAQRENPEDLNVATADIVVLVAQGQRDEARRRFTDSRVLQNSDRARRIAAIVGAAAPETEHRESPLIEYLIALAQGQADEALSQVERFAPGPFYFRTDFRELAERDDVTRTAGREAAALTLAAGYALDLNLPALAARLARQASERLPAMIPAYAAEAQARATLGWDKQPLLERIEQRLPATGLTLILRAREASRGEDHQGAVEFTRRALQREPEHLRTRYSLSQHLAAAGQYDEAIERLGQLHQEQTPLHVAVANDLAYLMAEHQPEHLEEAARIAQEAHDKRPDMAELVDTVAWIAYKQGEHARALRLLQRVAVPLSRHREVLYHLGAAYEAAGNSTWARYYLEQVAAGEADDPITRRARQRLEG